MSGGLMLLIIGLVVGVILSIILIVKIAFELKKDKHDLASSQQIVDD